MPSRERDLVRRYGMSEADYRTLSRRQAGVCALCGTAAPGRRLGVDHDHDTGAVRGLLCIRCNSSLAQLGDDSAGLFRAYVYVTQTPADT